MSNVHEALAKGMEEGDRGVAVEGSFEMDEFLSFEDLIPINKDSARRTQRQALAEAEELMRENKWEDLVAVFRPVEEKAPELIKHGLEAELRAKVGFALGQLNRFDEAIEELAVCVKQQPDNFLWQSSLGFTAYNSLFAAANREIFLHGKAKKERVELAHLHLANAQKLRPDNVTSFYREGMLYKKIERKAEKALPLFQRAVGNWESLEEKQKETRHQEQKNYVKALYQLASCLLDGGDSGEALKVMKRCVSADEKTNYLSLVYKYFALGKIHFERNNYAEARDALLFAAKCKGQENDDFVYELLGRTYLAMGHASRALEIINKVPEKRRRAYYRWTEADILCAVKELARARSVLMQCQERDNRSRHKALMRLARIDYATGDYGQAMQHAAEAGKFFEEKWGNRLYEALFWEALAAYRAGERDRSLSLAMELKAHNPRYPKLDILLERLKTTEVKAS